MRNLLFAILLFTSIDSFAQTLYSIHATVTDEKGIFIPGATAFLTNTKYKTPTNTDGQFTINNLQPGTYELVVKMIGYKPHISNISLLEKPANLLIRLKESNKTLKEVAIKSTDPNRDKYMAMFVKNFIGESVNAKDCKITNPQVLNFHFDKQTGVLTASSEKMLIIENYGLGYKLNYLITEFEFDTKSLAFAYKGYPYFEEISGTPEQEKKWAESRKKAYLGSPNHFFRAVFNSSAEKEGFYVFKHPDSLPPHSKIHPNWQLKIDSVFIAYDKNFRLLKEKYNKRTTQDTTELYVAYRGGQEPFNFMASTEYIKPPVKLASANDQLSKIQPLQDNIALTKDGILIPARSFFISGYWAWEKVAELTPFDYFVEFIPIKTDDKAIDPKDKPQPATTVLNGKVYNTNN